MSKALEDEVERVAEILSRFVTGTVDEYEIGIRNAARAAITAIRPTLSEEDRARMKTVAEEIRGYAGPAAPWLAKRADELLSLIDKLTEAG